jgi:hypothetical protein
MVRLTAKAEKMCKFNRITYEIRSTEIFEKLGWEKIEIILKKREHIMTFKALRGETPNYLSDLFVASHNDTYQLRSNDGQLYLDKPNTNFMKNSFSYRGAVSWNSLPAEIVDVYILGGKYINNLINLILFC